MSYVIEAARTAELAVKGGGLFPVHQIYCVGRNYADHAVEMGHDPDKEPPFFFMKPEYAVLNSGEDMQYPALSSDVHHEVELVVALAKGGRDVAVEDAMDLVYGYGVGIDMTRRDLQAEAKDKSRPWEAGKAFLHAAPCSTLVPISECGEMSDGPITLAINGQTRQEGNINQMIWKVPEVISRLSTLFSLRSGDLIFTGTPAGVGPIQRGEHIVAEVPGVGKLEVNVT
jgi:fumarylpyruvate hydrolase